MRSPTRHPALSIWNGWTDSSPALQVRLIDAKTDFRSQHRCTQVADPRFARLDGFNQFTDFPLGAAPRRHRADFDGIVAGAPAAFLQRLNLEHNWAMQHMFRDNFAGALSFDTTGDGKLNSLTKANILTEVVLAHCDANDGITDGVVSDPMSCNFMPSRDLSGFMCPQDQNSDDCFTTGQIKVMEALYDGPSDSSGVSIYKGKALGSEIRWPGIVIPHEGNNHSPGVMGLTSHYVNYLFYETDPGVPTMEPTNLALKPDPTREPPEYAWWQFNFDDFTNCFLNLSVLFSRKQS